MNFRKVLPLVILVLACFLPDAGAVALTPRHSHTTTLLPDGNILITGGVTDAANTTTPSVQMYNMATNDFEDWTVDATMSRSSHTATLMSDGRILIAGGFGTVTGVPGTPLNSLEICDPTTKSCSALPIVMSSARGGHTATLLTKGLHAGQVLLCGGQSGASETAITGSCDIFKSSATSTISPTGNMVSPRMGHATVMLKSGFAFATGGRNWSGTAWIYESQNELYDPQANAGAGAWTPVSALLQGRINHSATVLNNGTVFIAGGFNSVPTYHCVNNVGEECWTQDDYKYWGYARDNQDMGSHGFLDGAEYFDQNSGRSITAESTYGVMPYRVDKHSAVLQPDGDWLMHGGYGNIVRTMFSSSLNLDKDTVFMLSKTGPNTANLIPATSVVKFPMTFSLSRPVSGRLVDADAFFSTPLDPTSTPAVAVENVKIYMHASTAPLDGFAVGTLLGQNYAPGAFDGITQLQNPSGTAMFTMASLNSDSSTHPELTVSGSTLAFATMFPLAVAEGVTGDIQAKLALTLPKIYVGIKGTATIGSGTIKDPAGIYGIAIQSGGSAAIDVTNPLSCDSSNCLFETISSFSITGQLSNLSPGTTIYNTQTNLANGGQITVTLTLNYTADEIHTGAAKPAFVYGLSDIVIREMIFSSALGFTPKTNSWKDLTNIDVSPTLTAPVFDHTALLTPAADILILGGRNCEDNIPGDCLHGNKIFTAQSFGAATIFIPVYKNSSGATTWDTGGTLNSKRAFHTSTMLQTGEILTCGGSDGAKPLDTCELMDPVTKAWTYTGSMNFPRTRHTATLLPNGNVLVTGGATPSSAAVTTAEIYYPASHSWVLTTPMFQPRQNHTATLLSDGNVLVAGGDTTSSYSADSEIFISSTSYWQVTGSMATPRAQHTATLLKNGNVLMAGGINAGTAVANSEVFDSTTRLFVAGVTPMRTGRYGHTATLLRDGRVLLIGGSDTTISQLTTEIYNGAAWADSALLTYNRTNHRSLLLPNGKIMITGGETAGVSQSRAEGFDPDFSVLTDQGQGASRANHTSVITKDNYILNIGGWDGAKCLATTDIAYFGASPDIDGLTPEIVRQPVISTGTDLFNWGDSVTLQSGTTNFYGITEASGGGAGPMNSSQSNPRVYMQQIDNPSGFMIDLSTRIYSIYASANPNPNWEKTLSSITVITPSIAGDMPHGWYNMRVASNGLFSEGHTVQVTVPRPTGIITAPSGSVLGTTAISWSWDKGTSTDADGYMLYSATNSVFITTTAFDTTSNTVYYTQSKLSPNTQASVMVSAYNLGGSGPLSRSSTYYTLAATPGLMAITAASFESVSLQWDPSGNTPGTPYELSMCVSPNTVPCTFSDPLSISTPVPYSVNYTSTYTVISQLSDNQLYSFRVSARNGAGIVTDFNSTPVSTMTVGAINDLTGTAVSSSAISWSWDEATGSGVFYEIYDITAGTASAVRLSSTSYNYYTQTGLPANSTHKVAVNAAKTNTNLGVVRGPYSFSSLIYTLTVQPLPGTPNVFTNVSTGSFTVNWITNGNPAGTPYGIMLSSGADFVAYSSFSTTGASLDVNSLAPNVRYYLRLYAVNGVGIAGTMVDLGSKYTLARAPLSVVPLSTTMSGTMLGWDTADNSTATIYEVRGTTENFNLSVNTYVPFASLYNLNYYSLSGLLTGTTYYFDVAARNGEGHVTARIQAVPAAFTLAGPDGAPSASIGGTSDPSKATTISGTLPNGRKVKLYIPAGAFSSQVAIAISSSAVHHCAYLPSKVSPLEVAIFSESEVQPQMPLTLTMDFEQGGTSLGDIGDITTNQTRMVMGRYNPDTTDCLPLETTIKTNDTANTDIGARTVTATLNHFAVPGHNYAIFQLMVKDPSSGLADVAVYPNPFYPRRGDGFVTINNMPASTSVRIYTLTGEKIWEGTAGTTGILIWKGVNKSGYLVASGIYLAVIDSSAGKKVLKLAVER